MKMSMSTIVIMGGQSATGKTTVGRKLSETLRLPFLSKDDYKESLFDSLGVKDRDWSKQLGKASFDLLYQDIERFLHADVSMIVEANFKPSYDNARFRAYQDRGVRCIQVNCVTDEAVRRQRFATRAKTNRHPGHTEVGDLSYFLEGPHVEEIAPLDLNDEIITVDTTDWDVIDINVIVAALRAILKERGPDRS